MEETTELRELSAWDWIVKFNEKLTLIRVKMLDRKEFTEEEEELLKVVFRIWHNQEYPLYEAKMSLPSQVVSQNSLFADVDDVNITENADGTIIDITIP